MCSETSRVSDLGEQAEVFWSCKKTQRGSLAGEVMELEVPGRKPPGTPKKTGIKNAEEDLTEWNLDEEDVFDREGWGALIKRQTR